MTNTDEPQSTDGDAQTTDRESTRRTDGRPAMTDGDGTDLDPPTGSSESLFGDLTWDEVRRNLTIGAIVVLGLLATWAVFQVYASTSRAIAIWFSEDYVPIFEAAFNAVVVLVAVAGILALLRDLT